MKIQAAENELKSTTVWKYLNAIRPVYATTAINFVNAVEPLLASIKDVFPYYTRHDAHHGFRVLLRMEQILSKHCFDEESDIKFTADEVLLLICAAYGHDLGMAVFPQEERKLFLTLGLEFDKNWKENSVLHDYLRNKHSERGGRYISDNNSTFNIPQNLLFMLHKLMEAHNLSINELDIQLNRRFAAGSVEINLKQLACILCIADAIEFSETRVVDGVLSVLSEKLALSEDKGLLLSFRHNMQSFCIGDGVAIGNDGKILFTGTFTDPDTMSLAHNTIDLIEAWVRNYIDIDFQSHKKRLIIRADSIVRQLNIVGYDFERIGIRIKKENIIDLIASNSTWTTDTAIVIREILQNSVEACRYRQFHSSSNYSPQVTILFDTTGKTIEIRDNGCGMSRNIILNNFLTVGNSRSTDPSYSTNKYSSLARFGIGFWSVFTIAEKALITTAPFEHFNMDDETKTQGVEFEVSIDEFKDFTVFRPIERTCGTTIKLKLKSSINVNEMLYRIGWHVGSSEIPIKIIDDNGSLIDIPKEMALPSREMVFGGNLAVADQFKISEFNYSSTIDEIDIKIKLYYINNSEGLQFSVPSERFSLIGLQDRSLNLKFRGSGICGFLFNAVPGTSLLDLNRIGHLVANARNPRGYKFTINRMGLLDSPEYKHYKEVIDNEIHKCYREFVKQHNAFDAQTISRLNQQSRLFGGELHGSFTGRRLRLLLPENIDLIAFKLYKIDRTRTIENSEVTYIFYQDLIKENYLLWLFNPPYHAPGFNGEQHLKHVAYEFIKHKYDEGQNNYMLERTREADMIADNAKNGIIDATTIQGSSQNPFLFRKFASNDIDPDCAESFEIATLRNSWAGSVVERPIDGANFVKLYQHHFVVKPESLIAKDLKQLIAEGKIFQAGELVYRLENAIQGQNDPVYLKYYLANNGEKSIQVFFTTEE